MIDHEKRTEEIRKQWNAAKTSDMHGEYPIDFLLSEIDRLKDAMVVDENGNEYVIVCIMKEKIKEVEDKNARLREALEFYANENNWNDPDFTRWDNFDLTKIAKDFGDKAREALGDK